MSRNVLFVLHITLTGGCDHTWVTPRVKVCVLRPVQQPGSYWDRVLSIVTFWSGRHTEVTACDEILNLLTHEATEYLFSVQPIDWSKHIHMYRRTSILRPSGIQIFNFMNLLPVLPKLYFITIFLRVVAYKLRRIN